MFYHHRQPYPRDTVYVGKKKKKKVALSPISLETCIGIRYTLIDEAVTDPITGTDIVYRTTASPLLHFFSRYI